MVMLSVRGDEFVAHSRRREGSCVDGLAWDVGDERRRILKDHRELLRCYREAVVVTRGTVETSTLQLDRRVPAGFVVVATAASPPSDSSELRCGGVHCGSLQTRPVGIVEAYDLVSNRIKLTRPGWLHDKSFRSLREESDAMSPVLQQDRHASDWSSAI